MRHRAGKDQSVSELSTLVQQGESTRVWLRLYDELRLDPHAVQEELLFVAAQYGNIPVLSYLVDELRVAISTVDAQGATLLHHAVAGRQPDVIRWVARLRETRDCRLMILPDAEGRTPLYKAAAEQAVECLEALMDVLVVIHFGDESEMLPAVEATRQFVDSQMTAPGRRPGARLKRIRHVLDSFLRVAALSRIRFVLWSVDDSAEGGGVQERGGDSLAPSQTSRKLREITTHLEKQSWWPSLVQTELSVDSAGLATRDVRNVRELSDEFLTLQTAVAKGEPAVVEWLLDVWGVDFDGDGRNATFTLADYACAPGEDESTESGSSGCEKEWEAWWSDTLLEWATVHESSSEGTAADMSFDDLRAELRIAGKCCTAAHRRQLRLLNDEGSKGGRRQQHNTVAILRLFVNRFNERAVPRLDLLVKYGNWHIFAWLLKEGLVDLAAPAWGDVLAQESNEAPGSSESCEVGNDDNDLCGICLDSRPPAGFSCNLRCGHFLCTKCTRDWFSYHGDGNSKRAEAPVLPCPICRQEVVAPRIVHGDIMEKLQQHLPRESPWLLGSCGSSDPKNDCDCGTSECACVIGSGIAASSLGEVLMALAIGYGSGAFLEHLAALGVSAFRTRAGGGRSLLHLACERCQPLPLAWLLGRAAREGVLSDALASSDRRGRLPIDVAVNAEFEFGVRAILSFGPLIASTTASWVVSALQSSVHGIVRLAKACVARALLSVDGDLAGSLADDGCALSDIAVKLSATQPLRIAAEEHVAGASTLLRDFIHGAVVPSGRADVLRWILIHGWEQIRAAMAPPRRPVVCRFEISQAALSATSNDGLGGCRARQNAFDSVFDEVEALLASLEEAAAAHRLFDAHVVDTERGGREGAEAACNTVADIAARLPEELQNCSLSRYRYKRPVLVDPAATRVRPVAVAGEADDAPSLSSGVDETTDCGCGSNALCSAVTSGGDEDLVMWLLGEAADEWKCAHFSALTTAALCGHLQLLKTLWPLVPSSKHRGPTAVVAGGTSHGVVACMLPGCRSAYCHCSACGGELYALMLDVMPSWGDAGDAGTAGSWPGRGALAAFPVNNLVHRCLLAWSTGGGRSPDLWRAAEWMAEQPEVSAQAVLNLFHWKAHFPSAGKPKGLSAGERAAQVLELLVLRGRARLDVLCPHDLETGKLSIAHAILRARLHECYALVVEEAGPGLMLPQGGNWAMVLWRQDEDGRVLLERLASEQEERFRAVDSLLAEGLPAAFDPVNELIGGVRLDRLRDRHGRPVLRAAIQERAHAGVLQSLADGLKRLRLAS